MPESVKEEEPETSSTRPSTPISSPAESRNLCRHEAVFLTGDDLRYTSSQLSQRSPEEVVASMLLSLAQGQRAPRASVSEILPNRLYLSDVISATTPSVLRTHGITHIVTVMRKEDIPERSLNDDDSFPHVKRHAIPILDKANARLRPALDGAVEFISQAYASDPKARVLCHCFAGVSRSASVVVAYLVAAHNMTLDEALKLVRSRRNVARPNDGFMAQLRAWVKDRQAVVASANGSRSPPASRTHPSTRKLRKRLR